MKTIETIYDEEDFQLLKLEKHFKAHSGATTIELTEDIHCKYDALMKWNYKKKYIKNYVIEAKNREQDAEEYNDLLIEENKYIFLKSRTEEKLYICFILNKVYIFNLDKLRDKIEALPILKRLCPKAKLDQTKVLKDVRLMPKKWAHYIEFQD